MTRIEISPWRNSKVFGSRTTSGQTFVQTRSSFQVDHKVEEIESFSLFIFLDDISCKLVILIKDLWKIFFADCIRIRFIPDNRFDRHLLEAKLCKVLHIL